MTIVHTVKHTKQFFMKCIVIKMKNILLRVMKTVIITIYVKHAYKSLSSGPSMLLQRQTVQTFCHFENFNKSVNLKRSKLQICFTELQMALD